MRLRAIVCDVLSREFYRAAAESSNVVDIDLMPQRLHDLGAEKMSASLQRKIDEVDPKAYDAIVLGYGLCSRGTEGLRAREVRIAIPRAHDCVTLLLGGRDRYDLEFGGHPGTYFCSAGWHERNRDDIGPREVGVMDVLGLSSGYDEYVRLYGEENAQYIIETIRGGLKHYTRVAFVEFGLGGEDAAREAARELAEREGWAFETIPGDLSLIRKLLAGEWADECAVLEPGEKLFCTHDDSIIRSCGRRCD